MQIPILHFSEYGNEYTAQVDYTIRPPEVVSNDGHWFVSRNVQVVRMAVVGPSKVGKSSFLNAFFNSNGAIEVDKPLEDMKLKFHRKRHHEMVSGLQIQGVDFLEIPEATYGGRQHWQNFEEFSHQAAATATATAAAGREINYMWTNQTGRQGFYRDRDHRTIILVHGVVLLYAIDNQHSFEKIQHLRKQIHEWNDKIPMVLVGSKRDLRKYRQVKTNKAKKLAREWGIPFCEISVVVKEAINEPFTKLINEIKKNVVPANITRSIYSSVSSSSSYSASDSTLRGKGKSVPEENSFLDTDSAKAAPDNVSTCCTIL